jgi:glucokinase
MTTNPPTPDGLLLAVDIGGTKIAAAVLTCAGQILDQSLQPTLQAGPEAGLAQVNRILDDLIAHAGIREDQILGIGVGIPAVLDEQDFVIWGPNLKGWRGVDLRGSLERHFQLPVRVEYDGHTAVLGEWWQGAGKKDCRSLVSVIIGTGVGGGMVLEGRLVRGVSRLAGAVGWFIIDPPGSPAREDQDAARERSLGAWEARIAGPGIALRAGELLAKQPQIPSLLRKTSQPGAAEVFDAAQQGDELAGRITAEVAGLLGMGLANIVSLVNPEVIVLGGSVGSHAGFLLPQVRLTLESFAQPISAKAVRLETSQLGARAGLYGAAYAIYQQFSQPETHS